RPRRTTTPWPARRRRACRYAPTRRLRRDGHRRPPARPAPAGRAGRPARRVAPASWPATRAATGRAGRPPGRNRPWLRRPRGPACPPATPAPRAPPGPARSTAARRSLGVLERPVQQLPRAVLAAAPPDGAQHAEVVELVDRRDAGAGQLLGADLRGFVPPPQKEQPAGSPAVDAHAEDAQFASLAVGEALGVVTVGFREPVQPRGSLHETAVGPPSRLRQVRGPPERKALRDCGHAVLAGVAQAPAGPVQRVPHDLRVAELLADVSRLAEEPLHVLVAGTQGHTAVGEVGVGPPQLLARRQRLQGRHG